MRSYDDFHREVTLRLRAGEHQAAATLALEVLGPEIMGFVMSMTRDETTASEVFSDFCEDMWRGLPAFRGEASFRTWAYTLARHAVYRQQRDPYRKRRVALSNHPVLSELEARIRTTTLAHLKSEVREAVTRLRDKLAPDDQALLVLRIDRNLSFQEVAVILSGTPLEETERKKRAAALRKRVERLKQKLRTMAEAEGLLRGEA